MDTSWNRGRINYLMHETSKQAELLVSANLNNFLACFREPDGLFLIEADRLLKPGGYFVLTSPASRAQRNLMRPIEVFTQKLCWSLLVQQEETFIWQKTVDAQCYTR